MELSKDLPQVRKIHLFQWTDYNTAKHITGSNKLEE